MMIGRTCKGRSFSGRAIFKMRREKETTNERREIFVTDAQLCVIWDYIFDFILVLYFITVKMQKWAVCWLPLHHPPPLDVHPSDFAFTWTIDYRRADEHNSYFCGHWQACNKIYIPHLIRKKHAIRKTYLDQGTAKNGFIYIWILMTHISLISSLTCRG